MSLRRGSQPQSARLLLCQARQSINLPTLENVTGSGASGNQGFADCCQLDSVHIRKKMEKDVPDKEHKRQIIAHFCPTANSLSNRRKGNGLWSSGILTGFAFPYIFLGSRRTLVAHLLYQARVLLLEYTTLSGFPSKGANRTSFSPLQARSTVCERQSCHTHHTFQPKQS